MAEVVGNVWCELSLGLLVDRSEREKRAVVAYLSGLFSELPDALQKHMAQNAQYAEEFGLRTVVSLGDLTFDRDDFWRAAGAAIDGHEAKLVTLAAGTPVLLRPLEEEPGKVGFGLEHPLTHQAMEVQEDELAMLSARAQYRDQALRRNPHWFDLTGSELEGVIQRIVEDGAPQTRMDRLDEWRGRSLSLFYRDLYDALRSSPVLDEDDLLPTSGEAMLTYLRLDRIRGADLVGESLDDLVTELAGAGQLYEAIVRASGLPVPLPRSLMRVVGGLSPEKRLGLVRRLVRTAGSPLSKLHLIRLLLDFQSDRPSYVRLARHIMSDLVLNPEQIWAFCATLRWTYNALAQWPEARAWSPGRKLSVTWSHTDQLCRMFSSLGVPASWMQEQLGSMADGRLVELFAREPALVFDVAHPRFVTPELMLLTGLSHALHECPDVFDQGFRKATLSHLLASSGTRTSTAILADVIHLHNSLNSFLGMDRHTALTAFAADGAEVFSSGVKQAIASEAVEDLAKTPQDVQTWQVIHLLTADLPVDQDLNDILCRALEQIDFVALTAENSATGVYAMYVSSGRAEHLSDEPRRHLTGQFNVIASLSLTREQKSLLIDVALNLSRGDAQPPKAFAEHLGSLLDVWHDDASILSDCRMLVQSLTERLPVGEAQHLWPLLVSLRAR